MGKVAAIINLEINYPKLDEIDYSLVDRRYVYENEKGCFGINIYAS